MNARAERRRGWGHRADADQQERRRPPATPRRTHAPGPRTTADIAEAIRQIAQAYDGGDADALRRAAYNLDVALDGGAEPPGGITRARATALARTARSLALTIADTRTDDVPY